MQQVFYIDADEEITSVIDRLKKSKASENFFVVPKRALFLQSVVNLKLLKKEADKAKKRIIVVTQDEMGTSFSQKVGIEVRPSTEGIEIEKEGSDDLPEGDEVPVSGGKASSRKSVKKNRLENIGSREFFNGETGESGEDLKSEMENRQSPEARELKKEKPRPVVKKGLFVDDMSPKAGKKSGFQPPVMPEKPYFESSFSPRKEEKIELLFRGDQKPVPAEDSGKRLHAPVSKKVKKVFLAFGAFCVLVLGGMAAYLFIPRAKIAVYPRYVIQELDSEITGDVKISEVNKESGIVPAKMVEKSKSIKLSHETAGKTSSSSQKARGTVVIFNEYSAASQPLVATTRLLSSKGKLFRLVKGIVVPGMASAGGELKPGEVEAEVIADEGGESYNIGPAEFSIPGFEGGPKYEKFYARSEKPMAGGGSTGSEIPKISQEDIDNARQKTEAEIKSQMEEEIKQELSPGEIILAGASELTVEKSAPLAKVGDAKEKFEYQTEASLKAIVFSENDVKEIITGKLRQKGDAGDNISVSAIKTEYRQASSDFDAQLLKVKIHSKVYALPQIDLEKLKNDFAGKNESQARETLKKYPQVEKVEIEFWPKFFPERIPQYGRQVIIELKESNFE